MGGMQGLAVIKRKRVEELTGRSRSAIYADMKAGKFPKPVKIGERAVGWRVADIMAWLDSRVGV